MNVYPAAGDSTICEARIHLPGQESLKCIAVAVVVVSVEFQTMRLCATCAMRAVDEIVDILTRPKSIAYRRQFPAYQFPGRDGIVIDRELREFAGVTRISTLDVDYSALEFRIMDWELNRPPHEDPVPRDESQGQEASDH